MTHINYLQAKKNYTILHSISEILKKNKLEGADSLTSLADKSISKQGFFEVIDRESPTTGVWVLDWVIHNRFNFRKYIYWVVRPVCLTILRL